MSVLSTLFNILSPRVMGLITNKLVEGIKLKLQGVVGSTVDFDYITKVLLLLGGLYIFSAFFQYIQHYMMAGIARRWYMI